MFVTNSKNKFSVKAYRGDAKTLLAFNMPQDKAKDLAGFTICCGPKNNASYYLFNALQFSDPKQHFQDPKEPPFSSVNAPFQKFQWLHVPGQFHQDEKIFYGSYDYTVTPRYFKNGKLQQMDNSLSVVVTIEVSPFTKNAVEVGFTRGFVQSQAFVRRFGLDALISPKGSKDAFFNTTDIAGSLKGKSFTFKDEYTWSGFTAREKIFAVLNEVTSDKSLSLYLFAYDLYEPDFSAQIFQLAKEGRVKVILDNATLHHSSDGKLAEDQFEAQFRKVAKTGADIKRGKFSRFSHCKVLVVMKGKNAVKVLTGSTNFSVTGMYVNSNHVVIFNDTKIAQTYADVFNESWNDNVSIAFAQNALASKTSSFTRKGLGKVDINFSPHQPAFATAELQKIADRVSSEKKSVLFAVMDIDGSGVLLPVLQKLHASGTVFSFGISDNSKDDLTLYKPGVKTGILVSGKISGLLPPPFDKEKSIGIGHQIHHKFIVCNFNGTDAVVYCGSSNLSQGGEEQNGDNLLAIYDTDIATVFAIEALALVDHFNFRNAFGTSNHPANTAIVAESKVTNKTAAPSATAKTNGTFRPMTLAENSNWTDSYFSETDTHCQERSLLA